MNRETLIIIDMGSNTEIDEEGDPGNYRYGKQLILQGASNIPKGI